MLILHKDVLPQYKKWGSKIDTVLTNDGMEYWLRESHPYEIYLALYIKHRTTRVKRLQSNGFVERFNRKVLDEFFRLAFRTKLYESIEALQKDHNKWMVLYNNERIQ